MVFTVNGLRGLTHPDKFAGLGRANKYIFMLGLRTEFVKFWGLSVVMRDGLRVELPDEMDGSKYPREK